MQVVHLSNAKKLKFPSRGEDFAQGVEIGVVAVLMDMQLRNFARKLSDANLDQIEALAEKMGYRIESVPLEDGWTSVSFQYAPVAAPKRPRAHLTLVHSG